MKFVKLIFFLLSIIIISIFVRLFIGEPCHVSSASMEPTIISSDWLWVNKVTYGANLPIRWSEVPIINILTWSSDFRTKDSYNNWGYQRLKGIRKPKVNDIVVFISPENSDELLVKRIEKILYKGSSINIDSANLYLFKEISKYEIDFDSVQLSGNTKITYQIKNNYYFLSGDNSPISHDSRFFGYINENDIIGRVSLVLFSTKNINRIFKKIDLK